MRVDGQGICRVNQREMLDLNQAHVLPVIKKGAGRSKPGQGKGRQSGESEILHLEDGIRLDYSSPLARAKMAQCALALGPIVESLVDGPNGKLDMAAVDAVRVDAIVALRRVLDITTFQRAPKKDGSGGRDRDRGRYCGDDCARFATFGEGHCHTVTSTMAGFLYPFTELLGLDMQYREDTGGHHQWLDVVMRPNMTGLVVDLYRADGYAKTHDGPPNHLLITPAEEHYADAWLPCCKPRPLSGKPVVVSAIEDGDVEMGH